MGRGYGHHRPALDRSLPSASPVREGRGWGSALNLAPRLAHRRAGRSAKQMISPRHAVGFLAAPRGAERKVRESSYLLIRSHPAAIRPGPGTQPDRRLERVAKGARMLPTGGMARLGAPYYALGLSPSPGAAENATGGLPSARHRRKTTSNKGQKNPAIRGCPAAPPGVLSTHAEDGGPLSPSTAPTVSIVQMSVRSRSP
jgi:hypothetical protein